MLVIYAVSIVVLAAASVLSVRRMMDKQTRLILDGMLLRDGDVAGDVRRIVR